jgi:hypothetical protein
MNLRLVAFALLAAALLAGCDSIDSRINRKSAVFTALPAADQARLRQGTIAVGDTTDMVYIAIGEPSRRIEKRTGTGTQFIWIYRQYTESYEGSDFAGYRRRIYYDPRTRRHFVSLEPCYVDVYREEAEDALRIVFEDGRVKVIEELKR